MLAEKDIFSYMVSHNVMRVSQMHIYVLVRYDNKVE